VGLYRCPDGRWRINATGAKFTEADERRAVQKFREWQAANRPVAATVTLDAPYLAGLPTLQASTPVASVNGQEMPADIVETLASGPLPPEAQPVDLRIGVEIPEAIIWPWLREQLITRPDYIAKMVNIPEVAALRSLKLVSPIRLDKLISEYEEKNPSSKMAKDRAVATFRQLVKHAEATTTDDLTTEKLMAWRNEIEKSKTIKSAETKKWMFGQVKALISFGKDVGLNVDAIDPLLSRCSVLWTGQKSKQLEPNPISRDDYHKLLTTGNGTWRAWLLVGLNLCLHIDEACNLETADFDLKNKTYCTIRNKTAAKRVPRAAVLWPQTIEAIAPLVTSGKKYLFTSAHGTKYNKNGRCNMFKELREKAGVKDVTFDSLRDGAYTAACMLLDNDKYARLLAGHRAEGMQDNYVLRNPEIVRPATDAVYRYYFGDNQK